MKYAKINRCDGQAIRVPISSLAKHGLSNGQTLTREQWNKIAPKLALEWVQYVEALSD